MREIKFRAWNTDDKIMCYSNEDEDASYWDGVYQSTLDLINSRLNDKFPKYEFMQYTGLKDKNGVEIYEGDIIEHRDGYPRNYKNYKVVKFEDGEFTNCYSYDTGGATTAHPFVIGNIYENPELLETK